MAVLPVNTIRHQLLILLKGYFQELKNTDVTIDTSLGELDLGDTWLIEFVFVVEDKYGIEITMHMANKHFVRIRNAARYLSKRNLQYNSVVRTAEEEYLRERAQERRQ